MSSRDKKKARNKSGMLTGLMIVSTGLIAGFQGFDLAMSEQKTANPNISTNFQPATARSHHEINKQVDALDQLINASLKKNKQGADRQGLAHLIKASQQQTQINSPAIDNGPLVNRALKRDRGQATDHRYRDALNSIKKAARQLSKPKPAIKKTAPKPAKIIVAKAAPIQEVPIADSAEIALFAADMPLPAKLVFSGTQGRRMPSLPGRYARDLNGSPLVPRTFRTGKAFGGLAEREFQNVSAAA